HAGSGALVGANASGPIAALVGGVIAHGIGDLSPHGEIHDRPFEIVTGVIGPLVLASRLGWSSPIVWGAIGGMLPDVEHVIPKRMRSVRGYYPTHRFASLHSSDG